MSDTRQFCCAMMAAQVRHRCEQHADPFDCPDALIHYAPQRDEYGLIIHDGGSSSCTIQYCPWCGTSLSAVK